MNSESIMTHLPNGETIPVHDRMVGESSLAARPETGAVTTVVPAADVVPARSLVQWGPILAGFFSATAIFLLLTALGIAIGASVLEPRGAGVAIGPWPAVWAAISLIVAFLFGGWVASRSTLLGSRYSHLMDGFVVGAAGLTLMVWWSTTGLANLLGTIGLDVGRILASAGAANPQAFDLVRQGGFITFVWFLLPLIAATVGGYLGQYQRVDFVHRHPAAAR
jgi:hypothetical protein